MSLDAGGGAPLLQEGAPADRHAELALAKQHRPVNTGRGVLQMPQHAGPEEQLGAPDLVHVPGNAELRQQLLAHIQRRPPLPVCAGTVQQHVVPLREVVVQVAGGVPGAGDAGDLQHTTAAELVQRERCIEGGRHLQPVGLDAPHEVQLRLVQAADEVLQLLPEPEAHRLAAALVLPCRDAHRHLRQQGVLAATHHARQV
mmetsp:Transcript_18536/g.55874  ORF Transcript_18536/g.55874 Transcript_18536/m.55874 type:complete len:200 (-) Transcript_18536:2085-2684(-)